MAWQQDCCCWQQCSRLVGAALHCPLWNIRPPRDAAFRLNSLTTCILMWYWFASHLSNLSNCICSDSCNLSLWLGQWLSWLVQSRRRTHSSVHQWLACINLLTTCRIHVSTQLRLSSIESCSFYIVTGRLLLCLHTEQLHCLYMHINTHKQKRIDWVKVLHPIRHKISHFRDVLPSQSLDLVLKNWNKHNKSKHASVKNWKNTITANMHP